MLTMGMGLISEIFLPLALAFIMFSLGLGLTISDFSRVLKQPKDFLIGAFSQIIILPIVALILVLIWPLSPELAIGVMLIAAAPGGATSNIITSFAKGDVALSVSLTAIISLLSVFTIPLIVLISLNILVDNFSSISISILDIAIQMFAIVTIPVILGILFRKFMSNFSILFEPIAKKISALLFAIVLLGAVLAEKDNIILYFSQAGLITLILNILMMIIAFYIAKFFVSGVSQRKTIIVECGLQNGTLAIVVATSVFGGGVYLIPAATYSLIMFASSLIYIYFARRS
jgi:BASS family bile acid:Na+ symporter